MKRSGFLGSRKIPRPVEQANEWAIIILFLVVNKETIGRQYFFVETTQYQLENSLIGRH